MFGLFRVLVYSGFWFIQGSCLFRVPVYAGFLFIQGSGLFRVRFRQVSLYIVQNTFIWVQFIWLLYPCSPEGEGGILFYLCPSVRPSKIFFVTFFSATIDGRNLIFGHKLHIGMPYCGKRFWTRQIPTSCLPTWLIFIHKWALAHSSSCFHNQFIIIILY